MEMEAETVECVCYMKAEVLSFIQANIMREGICFTEKEFHLNKKRYILRTEINAWTGTLNIFGNVA